MAVLMIHSFYAKTWSRLVLITLELMFYLPPSADTDDLRFKSVFHGKSLYNEYLSEYLEERPTLNLKAKRAVGTEEQGMVVSPQLTLAITDVFNRPLISKDSPTELRVGDNVIFVISLKRDGTYDSLEVLQCIMTSSEVIPDPNAETRVLLVNGCPITDEATAGSWYWTSEKSTKDTFVSSTQPVAIFRLASSEYIYLHCSMKLCFSGSAPCQQPSKVNCTALASQRKKRHDVHPFPERYYRSASTDAIDVSKVLALRVIDPSLTQKSNNPLDVGNSGFIVLIVLITIIGVVVIVLIIVLMVALFRRVVINSRQQPLEPQEFTQQRITPRRKGCLTCV